MVLEEPRNIAPTRRLSMQVSEDGSQDVQTMVGLRRSPGRGRSRRGEGQVLDFTDGAVVLGRHRP